MAGKGLKNHVEFDYCTSNPAFNIATENNLAGTGGNTTLYKTATNHAFQLLKPHGALMNITLKGIVNVLVNGKYKDYQTHYINLMDDIDVWTFNTCFFILEKSDKSTSAYIDGGLASKIYSPYKEECIPFVYYSGSNNGMNKFFNGSNKVIRQLPFSKSETVVYDYTDKVIEAGPKFAFNVMESPKSYTVTDEPIYGGTICYIPTETIEQAEKFKLFALHNKVFKEYIARMKIRGYAFGLRNIRNFDIDQIVTGHEIPEEWNIDPTDLNAPTVIVNDIDINYHNQKTFGEVFTPTDLVNYTLDKFNSYYSDAFSGNKTFCDTMCGDGQFLYNILMRKVKNGVDFETALSTIYGVELIEDNVELCRERLLCGREDLRHIVEQNIVCADALKYHYRFDNSDPYKTEDDALFDKLFV